MNRYRKTRKDAGSEDAHVARGILGTIIVIALIVAAVAIWFPPPSTRAAPPPIVKLTVQP